MNEEQLEEFKNWLAIKGQQTTREYNIKLGRPTVVKVEDVYDKLDELAKKGSK